MKAVEGVDARHQARALGLEHLAGRAIPKLWMRVRLGPSDAVILEPGVEFGVALELGPRHEEPPPDCADVVLDLSLLPA